MSLLFKRVSGLTALEGLGFQSRLGGSRAGSVPVTADSALKHSAVWAGLRLRADLISSMPVDEYRRSSGRQVMVDPKSPILDRPGALFVGGSAVDFGTWQYATQFDLDRYGNCFGLKTYGANGLPARIDLLPATSVKVSLRDYQVQYRVDGKLVDTTSIHHELQYPVAGLPVGLSPLAYAAMGIGQYLSAQQFALDWFGGGAVPKARLKNTAKTINGDEAKTVKDRFRAAVTDGDLFVHGADWDYDMISAAANQSEFIATQRFSIGDLCRFIGVPGDMIDADTATGNVTYANVTQRNVQLLVVNLGPAIKRREDAWSAMVPSRNYVKLNTDAALRMDPKTRVDTLAVGVTNRAITPNEWRELDNRPPLTTAQEAEFARLFSPRPVDATVTKSDPLVLNVHGSPITTDARTEVTVPERQTVVNNEVDARTETTIAEGAVQSTHNVDATTALLEGSVQVHSAPVTVTVPTIEHRATTKRVETDDQGRITAIIEEAAD